MTTRAEVVDRRAARVLLIDGEGRVLLFRGCDPLVPRVRYWFTPGGGIEGAEELRDAAVRELFEETGLRLPPGDLTGPVYEDVAEFDFDGRSFRQCQWFFVARIARWTVDTAGFSDYERNTMDVHRWWSREELDRTGDRYYPAELNRILREVP